MFFLQWLCAWILVFSTHGWAKVLLCAETIIYSPYLNTYLPPSVVEIKEISLPFSGTLTIGMKKSNTSSIYAKMNSVPILTEKYLKLKIHKKVQNDNFLSSQLCAELTTHFGFNFPCKIFDEDELFVKEISLNQTNSLCNVKLNIDGNYTSVIPIWVSTTESTSLSGSNSSRSPGNSSEFELQIVTNKLNSTTEERTPRKIISTLVRLILPSSSNAGFSVNKEFFSFFASLPPSDKFAFVKMVAKNASKFINGGSSEKTLESMLFSYLDPPKPDFIFLYEKNSRKLPQNIPAAEGERELPPFQNKTFLSHFISHLTSEAFSLLFPIQVVIILGCGVLVPIIL